MFYFDKLLWHDCEMKKIFSFVFLVCILLLATVGSEFIKPHISYFTKSLVDKNNPFNFKNEYELLIFQNKQSETKDALKETLNQIELNFEIPDEEVFAQCIIDKNIESLNQLNNDDPKLNPINPKTVKELDKELKKYQPILIDVQTKSIQNCLPNKKQKVKEELLLSCKCANVTSKSPFASQANFECGSSFVPYEKGVSINFDTKYLVYGGFPYPLVETEEFYYGIDIIAWQFVKSQKSKDQIDTIEDDEFIEKTLMSSSAAAITIERLTGELVHNIYHSFYDPSKNINSSYGWVGGVLIPSVEISRQCKKAVRL